MCRLVDPVRPAIIGTAPRPAALPTATCRALRDAAVTTDGAWMPLRRSDPDPAIETWRALVAGRWALIDRFDSDGRRYLVARANPIGTPSSTALTPRERDVVRMRAGGRSLKVIAFELGLAISTVSGDLHRAADKLHLRSIAEVIALASALGVAGALD